MYGKMLFGGLFFCLWSGAVSEVAWKLVTVLQSKVNIPHYDKFPVNGQNVELLDTNPDYDWRNGENKFASYNMSYFNELWLSIPFPKVMWLHSGLEHLPTASARDFYFQWDSEPENLNLFQAIRNVQMLPPNLRVCEVPRSDCFDENTLHVTENGASFSEWPERDITPVEGGPSYKVRIHGIPADRFGGCTWIYDMNDNCKNSGQTRSFCKSNPSGAIDGCGETTPIVTSKIFFGVPDFDCSSCGSNAVCGHAFPKKCECPQNTAGDADVECTVIPCSGNYTGDAGACSCSTGYEGSVTYKDGNPSGCTDIDECLSENNCGPHALCENTEASYECSVDCSSLQNGVLSETGESCRCRDGFVGTVTGTFGSLSDAGCVATICPLGYVEGSGPDCECAEGFTSCGWDPDTENWMTPEYNRESGGSAPGGRGGLLVSLVRTIFAATFCVLYNF